MKFFDDILLIESMPNVFVQERIECLKLVLVRECVCKTVREHPSTNTCAHAHARKHQLVRNQFLFVIKLNK